MGRQILFHALDDDIEAFFAFAQMRDAVTICVRDSDRPEVEPVPHPAAEGRLVMLWNRSITSSLQREEVGQVGHRYFTIPYSSPVVELSPCKAAHWKGQPALLQGRLYGSAFDGEGTAYSKWFDSLRRWLRTHYPRNPAPPPGYVGPSAMRWFKDGGVLLPSFLPPATPAWEEVIAEQRRVRAAIR